MKLYIAVLDDCPDSMVPTLVAHTILGAHLTFSKWVKFVHDSAGSSYVYPQYMNWLEESFKKCVVRVNQREFDKIATLPNCYLGYESTVLEGRYCCAIPLPVAQDEELPNVLKFAKLWSPKNEKAN